MQPDKEKVKVIIVDDHPVVMEGLSSLLSRNDSIEVIGCFTNGNDVINFLANNSTDVVLLDITLPDVNGIDLCFTIKKIDGDIKVIALSNHNERSIILQMIQNGACGYLLKNTSSQELIISIMNALDGHLAFSREVQSILAQPGRSDIKKIPNLTRREKEILKLIAEGLITSGIAEKLYISPLTVETHRRNLIQKFEVNNTASLVSMAKDYGMI